MPVDTAIMRSYEDVTGTHATGLSDTLYLRRWSPNTPSGELIDGMFDALEFLHCAVRAQRGCARSSLLCRFYAREVSSILRAMRDGYGYSVQLPEWAYMQVLAVQQC